MACLLIFFDLLLVLPAFRQGSAKTMIMPPDGPRYQKNPARVDPNKDYQKLRRRRQLRDAKDNRRRTLKKSLTERLDEVSRDPGPMRFIASAVILLPYLVTGSNNRKNYYADPSAMIQFYLKPSEYEAFDNTELWTGFRLASFSGAGRQGGVSGDFGFLYFGPMLGLGKVSPPVLSVGVDEKAGSKEKLSNYDRSGFFWMSGLALVSRASKVEKGREKPEDFNSKEVDFDSPGLWTEVSYGDIRYSRIGLTYTFGVQVGKGKIFTYFGFGSWFWH